MKSRMIVAAMVLAVGSAGAFGQVQVQQTNPLDANPQVGSGGSNVPVPGYAPVNGNNIVTGNVSGLGYFHAPTSAAIAGPNGAITVVQTNSLGTFSPYEFQGQLGSANFFNFARQSAGGAQTSIGQTQAYYLPSTTVSTGQGSLYSAPYGNGFDSALAPSYAVSPATPYGGQLHDTQPLSTGIAIRQFTAQPANPSPTQDLSGNLSSSLFGLRSQIVSPNGQPSNVNGTEGNDRVPGGPALNDSNNQNATPSNSNLPTSPDNNNTNGIDNNDTSNGLSASARVKARPTTDRPQDSDNNQALVSTTYRTLLQRLQDAQKEAAAQGVAKNGGKEGNASADNTAGNGQQGTAGANGQTTGAAAKNGQGGTLANGTSVPGLPGEVTGRPRIDPLTGRPMAPGTGMTGVMRSNGTGMTTGGGTGMGTENGGTNGSTSIAGDQGTTADQRTGGLNGTAANRGGAMARNRLTETPTSTLQAGRNLPPLQTLADVPRGGKVTPFDTLMKEAEGLLKGGKYLEAADAYQTAITTEPDNALAVIGRAQAELGAGMYQSAANDLRFVFTRKPELMAVHYPVGDYIPAERQNYLIKDLQELTTNRGPGNTASFLLCYLYYNTGRNADVQAELGRWGNRAWRDSWEGVAAKAWGK